MCLIHSPVHLRSFLDRHGSLASTFAADSSNGGISWEANVLEEVTSEYVKEVKDLMETVKKMDSALQRRSKISSATPLGTNMADSDKISLQLFLDVRAYGQAVGVLCPGGGLVPSYSVLLEKVAPAEKLLDARSSS
jgi:Domain of unknown function (DUF3510)